MKKLAKRLSSYGAHHLLPAAVPAQLSLEPQLRMQKMNYTN